MPRSGPVWTRRWCAWTRSPGRSSSVRSAPIRHWPRPACRPRSPAARRPTRPTCSSPKPSPPDGGRMHDAGLTLNGAWLRNRVAELGLKHWWLAEQLGVDRKTVQRWLNGPVRTIRAENARALAGVLGCRVEALLLHDEAAGLATPDDQAHAATLLAAGRLIERLGPVGDWDVIESLIKATVVPQLPLHVLATLYDQLCI